MKQKNREYQNADFLFPFLHDDLNIIITYCGGGFQQIHV